MGDKTQWLAVRWYVRDGLRKRNRSSLRSSGWRAFERDYAVPIRADDWAIKETVVVAMKGRSFARKRHPLRMARTMGVPNGPPQRVIRAPKGALRLRQQVRGQIRRAARSRPYKRNETGKRGHACTRRETTSSTVTVPIGRRSLSSTVSMRRLYLSKSWKTSFSLASAVMLTRGSDLSSLMS